MSSEYEDGTDVISSALREMTETEEDLHNFSIPFGFADELNRIRLDLGLAPTVHISDTVIKMVLLAKQRHEMKAYCLK